jgi:hypothetical protein
MIDRNKLLWVATIISIATYQLWTYLPKGSFYIGNALTYFLLALVIYNQNKTIFISFLLLCLTINNLLDELFFDPTKNGLNEIVFSVLIPVIYYARKNYTK